MPFFSIVTPSFNQRQFVRECLESVAGQTFADYEHLIFDGGSTDGSVALLEDYARTRNHVSLVVGEDRGQVDAINQGFHAAGGEYLLWLNTDDYFIDAETLADVKTELEREPVDFLYGCGEFVDADGDYIQDVYINDDPARLRERFMVSVGILQPATFIKRAAFESLGDLLEFHPYCFDYEFWMRAAFAQKTFRHTSRKITRATLHNDSKTVGTRVASLRDTCAVNKEYYGFVAQQWLEKLVDCELHGSDGIVSKDSKRGKDTEAHLREVFEEFNQGKDSVQALLSRAHVPEAHDSLRALFGHWDVDTRRAIVTAFDDGFFDSGLTLISGLQRLPTPCAVFVYDIGLNDEHKAMLSALDGVFVLTFDALAFPFCDDYFTPITYGFKSYAMWHARHYLQPGDSVLWMDAGIYPISELSEIFAKLDQSDVFLVDHDDKGIWPVANVTFTSDACITAMQATPAEIMGPALRAGVAGYKVGGRFQGMFDAAFEFSLDPDALCGDKHPKPPIYRTRSGGTPEERRLAEQDEEWRDRQPLEKFRELYGYFGHRHDQSILSILAVRHGAPHWSAKEHCIADDASSASSKARWADGASLSVSQEIPDFYRKSSAELMQHRGLFSNTRDLRFTRTEVKGPAMIMGNGPSLRGFDFERLRGLDVFGMNAAYRFWEEIDWYPAYYSCLDLVVGLSHRNEIGSLIERADELGMRLFLLRQNLIDELGVLGRSDKVLNFDTLVHYLPLLQAPTITTGSHTAAWAAVLGYRDIYMLGIDCNYVERVAGSQDVGVGTELEIVEEKDNPNYFFDGYQRKGDRYNVPNPDRDIHMSSWREVAELIHGAGASILNANLESKVDSIDFCRFEDLEKGGSPNVIPRATILGEQPAGPSQTEAPMPEPKSNPASSTPAVQPPQTKPVQGKPNVPVGGFRRRLGGLFGALFRHLKRYGLVAVPYAVAMVGLAYATVLATGQTQLVSLGLLLVGGIAGVALLGAEAARRMKLHLFEMNGRLEASRQALKRDRAAFDQRLQSLSGQLRSLDRTSSYESELRQAIDGFADKLKERAPKTSLENLRSMIFEAEERQNSALVDRIEPLAYELSQLTVAVDRFRDRTDELAAMEGELQTLIARMSATVTVDQLDYRIEQTDQSLRQRLDERVGQASEALSTEIREVNSSLDERISAQFAKAATMDSVTELQDRVREIQHINSNVNSVADDLTERIGNFREELKRLERADDELGAELESARVVTVELQKRMEALPDTNLGRYNLFNRALTPDHIGEYKSRWSRPLGIDPPERSMYYKAHRFTEMEGRLRGRLATDIETALLRALALESLQKKSVDILEIGTLFGIGAAMLYDHARDRFDKVRLTLLDPLDGYYGESRDILSGAAINEKTLQLNLAEAGVPKTHVRVIKHFSYEEEAIEAASDREYDYILIDGDHTRAGVEIDFKHYASLLRRGGLMLFDDYGSDEWPAVAEFVDEVVAADDRFGFVGSGWRTAIYRKVA
jgi:predicted O-methyltransferase YrrM